MPTQVQDQRPCLHCTHPGTAHLLGPQPWETGCTHVDEVPSGGQPAGPVLVGTPCDCLGYRPAVLN